MNDTREAEPLEPIRKVLAIRRPVATVFAAYTRDIGRWWPLATQSLGGQNAVDCVLETRAGGRLFERGRDGGERLWGRIAIWEPPYRLVHSWHPGGVLTFATRVEAKFQPIDAQLTRMVLVHDCWRPADADHHGDYVTGWDIVLRDGFMPYVEGRPLTDQERRAS
jgi:uncharacterized protein YndB with AHSA1/START domain